MALFFAQVIFSFKLIGISEISESTFNVMNSIFFHSKYIHFFIASSIAATFGGDFVQITIFIFYLFNSFKILSISITEFISYLSIFSFHICIKSMDSSFAKILSADQSHIYILF
jgi:hypothetical protein